MEECAISPSGVVWHFKLTPKVTDGSHPDTKITKVTLLDKVIPPTIAISGPDGTSVFSVKTIMHMYEDEVPTPPANLA